MSLIPGLPKGLDVSETVREFLVLLRSLDTKLDRLIELEEAKVRPKPCRTCEEGGRLRCSSHGPIMIPANSSLDAD